MGARVRGVLRKAIVARAENCCEYCGLPDDVVQLPHEPDHVIATQHGGETTGDNLAYTCWRCNHYKGPNLSSIDPNSGRVIPLFNPRLDDWTQHFTWKNSEIEPLTPIGRATARLLRFNERERIMLRTRLIRQGRYPFRERTIGGEKDV